VLHRRAAGALPVPQRHQHRRRQPRAHAPVPRAVQPAEPAGPDQRELRRAAAVRLRAVRRGRRAGPAAGWLRPPRAADGGVMATRLPDPADASATPATPPASQPAVDELSVLLPDMPLVIAGRPLVVREYRFGESLEVAVLAAPLIADIAATIATAAPRYDQVRPLFARHRALVMQLVAKSADVEPQWIASLGRAE